VKILTDAPRGGIVVVVVPFVAVHKGGGSIVIQEKKMRTIT